jgi:Leucine-rich repeat (LRR) protein
MRGGRINSLIELFVMMRASVEEDMFHAFGGLNYVQRLNLENNNLNSLENQWFVSMPSLRWLYLSRNSLLQLKNGIFT